MTPMERRDLAREMILDDVRLEGAVKLPRQKYISLTGQQNWCSSANWAWLSSWRALAGAKKDLRILTVGDDVIIIDPDKTKVNELLSLLS